MSRAKRKKVVGVIGAGVKKPMTLSQAIGAVEGFHRQVEKAVKSSSLPTKENLKSGSVDMTTKQYWNGRRATSDLIRATPQTLEEVQTLLSEVRVAITDIEAQLQVRKPEEARHPARREAELQWQRRAIGAVQLLKAKKEELELQYGKAINPVDAMVLLTALYRLVGSWIVEMEVELTEGEESLLSQAKKFIGDTGEEEDGN